MTIVTGLVLFAVVWTVVFFVVNPFGQVSQGERGEVVPGTPFSAPVDAMVLRKAAITTVLAAVIMAGVWLVMDQRLVMLEDFAWAAPPARY